MNFNLNLQFPTDSDRMRGRYLEGGWVRGHKWQRFHMAAVSPYLNGITNANI